MLELIERPSCMHCVFVSVAYVYICYTPRLTGQSYGATEAVYRKRKRKLNRENFARQAISAIISKQFECCFIETRDKFVSIGNK